MPIFNRDGMPIYYEVSGEGPALLLTHGYSVTSQMWTSNVKALGANHSVITWDMRGHGRSGSPRDDAAYSEALTTQDMAALLNHLGHESAIVGGLSLGGYMSLAFYADYPEMVDGLLIIDTGPGFKQAAAREAWNKTAVDLADAISKRSASALEGGSAGQASAEHDNIEGLVFAAHHMLTQQTSRVIDSLPNIAVPSIVVVGADDKPFLIATDYMAMKIPGAEKVVIANAGHSANIDQPEAFNSAITDFLRAKNL